MKKGKLNFLKPEKGNKLGQWLVEQGISAGFPSPAEDFKEIRISLDRELVKNKEATFYARVSGDSMVGAGLDDGDLLVIDRSKNPENGKIAICLVDGEFTVKRIKKDKNKLSKEMRDAMERGMKYSAKEYTDAIDFMKQSYESYKEVFEDYHGVITPSSSGVADKGLKSTGSADFQKCWTYLGLPTISLPLLTGENNLPLGVQLVGNKLDDLRFLGTANWMEKNCKDE